MSSTTWNVDPAHTDVVFATKHMMVTTVRGKFATVDGTVTLDEENPTAAFGSFRVASASLNTGVDQRDAHLRSADFLDVDTYPFVEFTSRKVEPKGGVTYAVTGNLTIRGVTRPITFDVEFLGLYRGMNGARRAGFHASAKVDREAWGLTWNVTLETGGWLVGKEIRLEVDLAVEAAAAAVAEPGAAASAA